MRKILEARTKPIPKRRAKPRRTTMLRSPEYCAFLREHGFCAGCWNASTISFVAGRIDPRMLHLTRGNCDPAHTENGGMSMKGPDSSCAPLCRDHHHAYDAGRKAFEAKYGLDMKSVAKAWWDLWQRRTA